MATVTIPEKVFKKGVVILSIDEYRRLQKQIVPTYYLTGKKAERLDRFVEQGLRDYREGRTIKAPSLKEAMRIYERRRAKS